MDDGPVRFRGLPPQIGLADGGVLRRLTEDDLAAVVAAVNANVDHLRPWMPWAQESVTMASQGEWLRMTSEQWDDGVGFAYGIFDPDGTVAGGAGLHVRNGPGVLEIGYWLAADHTGRGLATAVAAALARAAAALPEVHRIEIRCDEANVRSAAVPQRLGFSLVDVVAHEPAAAAETDRHQVWSLPAEQARSLSFR